MKLKKLLGILLLFTLILTIVGCSASIDDQVTQAKKQVEAAFNKKPLSPNKKSKLFSYHLPDNFEVKKEMKNNVILNQGSQTYILFINPEESSNSKLMYNTLGPKSKKFILNSTFQHRNRFGYVVVKKIKDNLYETSVGIGGVKMTTDSKTSAIADSAEEMMNIVSTVKYKK